MSSSRTRGYVRQLVRMRWLAACIGAALLYSAYTALDIEIPAVPVLGQIQICKRSLEAMAQGRDVERLGTVSAGRFTFRTGTRRHDDPDRAAALPGRQTKKGRGA